MTKQEKVKEILTRLKHIWPNPKTELNFTTPWELMVAVMLSAQATDRSVNKVTPQLFKELPDVYAFASSDTEKINKLILAINFHNNKAKNIYKAARMIVEEYGGEVPSTMEKLITLPGIARKSANVILGDTTHKAEGIAVDTHVIRLSRALGLTSEKDPVKIEKDLMQIVPREEWTNFSHLLVLYGRYYCTARKHCSDCEIIRDLCVRQ